MSQLPKILSLDKLAKSVGLCMRTIYHEIEDGHLETFKIRRRRVTTDELARKWIEGRMRRSGIKPGKDAA